LHKNISSKYTKYVISTFLSFGTNFTLTIILHEVFWLSEEISFAIGIICTFLLNFVLLKFYIFDAANSSLKKQFITYSSYAIGFRLSEYFVFLLFHSLLNFDYQIVAMIALSVSTVIKFFTYKYIFEEHRK